jgi:hypothetical protein
VGRRACARQEIDWQEAIEHRVRTRGDAGDSIAGDDEGSSRGSIDPRHGRSGGPARRIYQLLTMKRAS